MFQLKSKAVSWRLLPYTRSRRSPKIANSGRRQAREAPRRPRKININRTDCWPKSAPRPANINPIAISNIENSDLPWRNRNVRNANPHVCSLAYVRQSSHSVLLQNCAVDCWHLDCCGFTFLTNYTAAASSKPADKRTCWHEDKM